MDSVTLGDIIVYALLGAGLLIFGRWLLTTHFGTKALQNIPERRTRLPFWAPMAVLMVWVLSGHTVLSITNAAADVWQMSEPAKLALKYAGQLILYVLLTLMMCWFGWTYFVGRLKGFGLGLHNLRRDFGHAAGILLGVMPIVLAMVSAVILVGRLFIDKNFEMPESEGLVVLTSHPYFWLKAIVFVHVGIVVPWYEELLFRGLFQSLIRDVTGTALRGWGSVVMTSVLFALLHPTTHWPALFVLSLAIGYSYEKSGSLIQAILIHSFFNTSMMTAALLAE
ncbi:MAG TPA: CPBP family intramembrane glutamic endopeptidase [Sedimentisphaerales bacterium]|nr:CPBP family intramembrane glutamic endopeptidase [Sedimentisphaerales bacterium]